MLNYGHPIKDDVDSYVHGWANANGIDLESLLKMNNYFFKKIKKSLKQSAVFYEQRYSSACTYLT